MRIGQLARRLGLTTTDLIDFLATQKADPEANANSRLSDAEAEAIVQHFAPERIQEILSPSTLEVELSVEPEPAVVIQPEVIKMPTPPQENLPTTEQELPATNGEQKPEDVEVIRVSKVELQGLKVLGKIDLPQPKKKLETAPETSQEQRTPANERTRDSRRREQRTWKNPLEVQRQREAEEASRKREEELERQKEQRANHYYKKVKSVPTKSVRRVEEPLVVEDLNAKEPPKTVFGKVWRWLTS